QLPVMPLPAGLLPTILAVVRKVSICSLVRVVSSAARTTLDEMKQTNATTNSVRASREKMRIKLPSSQIAPTNLPHSSVFGNLKAYRPLRTGGFAIKARPARRENPALSRPDIHAFHRRRFETHFGRAGGLTQQRVGIIQTALQLTLERFQSERSNCIGAARPEPGIITGEKCGYCLLLAVDRSVYQPCSDAGPFVHRDLAIQERHQHLAQLGLQYVVEKFQSVVVDRHTLGLQPYVSAVNIKMGIQQAQQAKDALQLLLHGLRQRARYRVVAACHGPQLVENLIRPIVAENFRREHRLLSQGVGFN